MSASIPSRFGFTGVSISWNDLNNSLQLQEKGVDSERTKSVKDDIHPLNDEDVLLLSYRSIRNTVISGKGEESERSSDDELWSWFEKSVFGFGVRSANTR